MRALCCVFLAVAALSAADLPVTKVILYKNGIAYYERAGEVRAGEPGRLDFKAGEMDDVLKSLQVETSAGSVARVRYELSESLERKLAETGIEISDQQALVLLLDQWRGAHIELNYRGAPLTGTIVSGRLAALPQQGQKQELTVLADNGELRLVDLDAAASLKLTDPKLQQQLNDALAAIAQSRSKDKRAVFIDSTAAGRLLARYLVPAPVWKSSYRLLLPDSGEATLEGWAIVDNASGEDWNKVDLTVVSGKPVSFVSRLYEPRYLRRPEASLPDDQPVAPVTYESALPPASAVGVQGGVTGRASAGAVSGTFKSLSADNAARAAAPAPAPRMEAMMSSIAPAAEAREAGELFEYRFSAPVSSRKGESILLPFVQQKIGARKLLIYSDRTQANPRNAAELSNTTGKTLDGGVVTIYQPGGYSGEALMQTLKAGEKRLISYSVDQGTLITTNFDSDTSVSRVVKASRGVIFTRSTLTRKTTYTIDNVDAKDKTLLIEHPVTPTVKLVSPKPDETTANRHRFAVKLAPKSASKLTVNEERDLDETVSVSSMTPDTLFEFVRARSLSDAARKQLETIIARKREHADTGWQLSQVEAQQNEIARDQERLRQNINSLNRVEGQQAQVTRYATELARQDGTLAQLRDRQSELRKRQQALQSELNALMEKLEF